MGAHAKFAPSSASRWLLCPYSAVIGASLPNRDSEASLEGTRVHGLIERAILTGTLPDAEPEDVTYGVELVLSYTEQLAAFGDVHAEHKLVLSDDVWGTADVFQANPDVTTILDYKNGGFDVQAVSNKQLLTYAAGALEQHGPSKHYRLVIIQPNSRTAGDVPDVKQALVTLEQVEVHRELVLEAVKRGLGGEDPQSGRHCRYCDAFGNCEATQQMLPFISTAIKLMPHEVPDAMAVKMLRVLRGMGDFKKNLEDDLMKRFAAGAQVPDATVGTTSTHRKWQDERLAATMLMEKFGMVGVDPVSPATAEKMGAAGKNIAAQLAFKPPGRPTLKY